MAAAASKPSSREKNRHSGSQVTLQATPLQTRQE